MVVAPGQNRRFRIQISKFEYCQGKVRTELDDFSIYVYTPAMIAIEKLRAICQQMPEYPLRRNPTPRARDFYDIHAIVSEAGVNLAANESLEMTRHIFAVKEVPLSLLPQIRAHREFHGQDWSSVELTTEGDLKSFDFYFDFVLEQIKLLKTLWDK